MKKRIIFFAVLITCSGFLKSSNGRVEKVKIKLSNDDPGWRKMLETIYDAELAYCGIDSDNDDFTVGEGENDRVYEGSVMIPVDYVLPKVWRQAAFGVDSRELIPFSSIQTSNVNLLVDDGRPMIGLKKHLWHSQAEDPKWVEIMQKSIEKLDPLEPIVLPSGQHEYPFAIAAQQGLVDVLDALYQKTPVDKRNELLRQRAFGGMPALFLAIASTRLDVIRFLLEKDPALIVSVIPKTSEDPISFAERLLIMDDYAQGLNQIIHKDDKEKILSLLQGALSKHESNNKS